MRDDDYTDHTAVGIFMLILSLGAWIGIGWLLWDWINVNSFGRGIIFFLAWSILGGLAQKFVPLIIVLFLSVFSSNK